MNESRVDFFTGATLSNQENGDVRTRDVGHHRVQGLDGGTLAKDKTGLGGYVQRMIDFGAHEWTVALAIPKSPLLIEDRETSELEGAIALPGRHKILARRFTAYLIHSTTLTSTYGWQISQLNC